MTDLNLLTGFVDGRVSPDAFRLELAKRQDTLLDSLSAIKSDPPRLAADLFLCLVSADLTDLRHVVRVQAKVQAFLAEAGIDVKSTTSHLDDLTLLYDAAPKWLQLSATFLQSLVNELPASPTRSTRKQALRRAIASRVWCLGRPPRWLQDCPWPMSDGVPAVFVGQLPVPNVYRHEAVVYVFRHAASDRYETIVQTM